MDPMDEHGPYLDPRTGEPYCGHRIPMRINDVLGLLHTLREREGNLYIEIYQGGECEPLDSRSFEVKGGDDPQRTIRIHELSI